MLAIDANPSKLVLVPRMQANVIVLGILGAIPKLQAVAYMGRDQPRRKSRPICGPYNMLQYLAN